MGSAADWCTFTPLEEVILLGAARDGAAPTVVPAAAAADDADAAAAAIFGRTLVFIPERPAGGITRREEATGLLGT